MGVSAASVRRKRKLERDAPRQLVAPQLQLEQAKAARERLELERKRESFLARGTELKGHVTRILEVVDADDGVDDLRQFSDEQLADLRSAITAVQHAQTFYEAQHAKDMKCPLKRESNDKYALLKRTIAAGDGLASTTAASARPSPSPLPSNATVADERSSPAVARTGRAPKCMRSMSSPPPTPPGHHRSHT